MGERVSRSISPQWNHKAAMHGPWEAPRCSAGIAINQPTMSSKDIEKSQQVTTIINKPLSKNGHGNTQVKFSSTPIPKDLPPLLRARAVALSGKSVGVNIRRKCWGYRTGLETEGGSREGEDKEGWATQCRHSVEILPLRKWRKKIH